MTSLKRKREERWFLLTLKLMLHCGNEFRMEVCSFRFKFGDMVPRKGKIISSSLFGAVEYTWVICFIFYDRINSFGQHGHKETVT